MSSLSEGHRADLIPDTSRPDRQACWEFLSCFKVLCPAHGKQARECWLIPRTQCGRYDGDNLIEKLPSCMACPYFRVVGESHPTGSSRFLSEQMQKCSRLALELVYQKEESYVEMLNRIPDGLFTTDEEWRITFFNPAAEKITGFSAYDAVGMFCKDVFKNPTCETDCALKRAVAGGGDVHNRDYVITDIEGKEVPIICSTSAFRDNTGRVIGGLEIFKDITELKRLQEKILTREKKYRRIFEGSHEMIYTTNLKGRILDVNQAGVDLLGYASKQELLDLVSARRIYLRGRDRDRFLKTMNHEGSVRDFEVDFARKDGTPIHVVISSRRYQNPETGDIEFEGIIKDITRRKHAEDILRQRNLELSILNNIALTLNLTMDLNQILVVTLKHILKVLRLRQGAVFLIDGKEGKVKLQVKYGLPEEKIPEEVVFRDTLLMKHLINERTELKPEPAYPGFLVSYRSKNSRRAFQLSCFLITFKGRAVGFFGLAVPPSRKLSPHEIHLLGSIGNYLGGAVENTQLMETIRLHRQELEKLTEKLFRIQEQERRRIARELHDEAGQALAAVSLSLERLTEKVHDRDNGLKRDIGDIRKMINRTSSEIRRLSYRLHPTLLSDLGLGPALDLAFKEVKNHSKLGIEFRMVGFDQRLDPDMETVLYRFSQEALTNTLKHSGARHFRLSIIKSFPKIIFLAEDDGKGFHGQIVGSDKLSLGLLGMRERASLLGGTFLLRTRPGEGTRIRIEIPLADRQSYAQIDSHPAR